MTPQEQAYYAEMIRRLIEPPKDHPFTDAKDLGAVKGRPRKPGASMFSPAEAASNDAYEQSRSVQNYAALDNEIANAKDPEIKMQLEAEKQRLLSEAAPTVRAYDPNNPGGTGSAVPEDTGSLPADYSVSPPSGPPNRGNQSPPTPPGFVSPSANRGVPAPAPAPTLQLATPAAPGAPQAVAAAPIAQPPAVAPAAPVAPPAPPVAAPAPIAPPVPSQGAMPGATAVPGQAPPMGVQGPQAAPPPGGMDPWAAASTQLDPKIAPGSPQTPEERDRRASGWKIFLDRLQTDPNLQAMFLKMGTQMMQPIQPGQNAAGHAGAALQSGVDYAVQTAEMRRKAGLEAGAAARSERQVGTQEKLATQEIAASKGTQAREEQKIGPELEALKARTKSAKTADEAAMAELKLFAFRLEHKDEIFANEQAGVKADTRQKNAHADFYEEGKKNATATKNALTRNGAAEAVAYFDQIVFAENKKTNGQKKPSDKGYETLERTALRIHTDLPNSLQAVMKARTEAGGGGAAPETPGATNAPGVVWTEELMRKRMKELDDAANKKPSPSSIVPPSRGGRIGPRD